MGSIALVCALIFISGFSQDATGEKPKMFPVGETLSVDLRDELRIECYSKEAKLQFSFPEPEILHLRSHYKILQFGNGTYTFLRGPIVRGDVGWYGCAEEGIEIDNHFSNINHTHKDISWIYVYVKRYVGSPWFTDGFYQILPKTIIVVAGSTVVVPCRTLSPMVKVQLWQNFEPVLTDGTAVQYDPKIGFIIKAVDFEDGEAVLRCTTEYDEDSYVLRLSDYSDTSGVCSEAAAFLFEIEIKIKNQQLTVLTQVPLLPPHNPLVIRDCTCQIPTMITAGSEITVQEGTELRIECCSETKLSFLFPEGFSNSSKYEIFANESGVKTFLRRSAVADDTGWYGCGGEGIRNDIPYHSINHTRKEISWIYVYVNSTVPITSGLLVYERILRNTIIPCRPTSPGLHVQLVTWRNGRISEPVRNVPFDPKLGFVLRKPYLKENVYACTTNEPIDYISKTYDLPSARKKLQRIYSVPTIVDVDDPLASKALSIRMTGEDLRLLCELVASEVDIFGLQWKIPNTVTKDRMQYHRTRADNRVDNYVRLRGKKSMMTITNISETDSGEYICIRRNTDYMYPGVELTAKHSRYVEVFDEHGGRFMKVGKQGGHMVVAGLKGGTVKWLLDVVDFPSANASWSDSREHLINDPSNPNRRRHVKLIFSRGSPYLLFTISSLTLADYGVYRVYIYDGNTTTLVSVYLHVQEPPVVSIVKLSRHTLTTEQLIAVDCWSYGSPLPHLRFSFLNLPKYPSHIDSKLTYLDDMSTLANNKEGTKMHYLKFNINMSGVLTCKACNAVNCSQDKRQILYSASDEPHFTSTNLNHSSVTLSQEKIKNSTTILECYAAGRPYPNVTWFKDKILLRENKQFNFAYDNRELRILNFYDGDSGRYTCKAENEHGKVENYIDITIEGAPNVLQTSLIIAASLLLGVIIISWVAIGKLRIELTRKKLIDSTFKNGALDSLNPELPIVDQAELLPYDMKWEFPRELLTLDKILGSGAFGIVKKAEAKSIRRGEPVTTVAVKLIRSKASLNFITALTRELKILVYLGKHINVVNLLGACTRNVSNGELLVIVEYCRFGNLHDYLIRGRADFIDETQANTRETSTSSVDTDGIDITDKLPNANDGNWTEARGQDTDSTSTSLVDENCTSSKDSGNAQGLRSNYRGDCEDMNLEPIRTRDLVYWSWQVSRGMDYLGKRKVVHGDLAARNILLAENGIVKISDFGLSKALYEEAQYRDQGVDPLPVKWMAPESIKDRVFSYQSDIWSFGIVMWEFFTLAKTPYPGIKCRELYQQLIDGYRMEKPEFATSTLYDTMLNCWKSDPSKRPSFIELAHSFDDSLDEGFKSHYLDMISSYIEINADMFVNGSKDYLTQSPSTFDVPASTKVSTQIEMDDLPHDESTNSE